MEGGPGGAVIDSLTFGPMLPGMSFGIPDCSSAPAVLARPTLGGPNAGPAVPFRRGDANGDGSVDIADPITVLLHLFAGGDAPGCLDAADADDSGLLDLSDAVRLLQFLFLGGIAPAEPFEGCELDATADELACETFRC